MRSNPRLKLMTTFFGLTRLATLAAIPSKFSPRTKLISATSMVASGNWRIDAYQNVDNSLLWVVLITAIKKSWARRYNNRDERSRGEEKSACNVTQIALDPN